MKKEFDELSTKLEERNREFFNKIARIFDKGIFMTLRRKQHEKILSLVNIKDNSKILDVGAGTGDFLLMLSKNKTLELHGIDISEEMLRKAKEKLGRKAKLRKISALDLDKAYKESYFDYVFVCDSFHHISEQDFSLKKMIIILKKGGKIIINEFDFGRIGNFIFNKIEPGNTGMRTALEYKRLFLANKLKDIKLKRMGLFSIYIEGIK